MKNDSQTFNGALEESAALVSKSGQRSALRPQFRAKLRDSLQKEIIRRDERARKLLMYSQRFNCLTDLRIILIRSRINAMTGHFAEGNLHIYEEAQCFVEQGFENVRLCLILKASAFMGDSNCRADDLVAVFERDFNPKCLLELKSDEIRYALSSAWTNAKPILHPLRNQVIRAAEREFMAAIRHAAGTEGLISRFRFWLMCIRVRMRKAKYGYEYARCYEPQDANKSTRK